MKDLRFFLRIKKLTNYLLEIKLSYATKYVEISTQNIKIDPENTNVTLERLWRRACSHGV